MDIETIRQELELYTGRFPTAAVGAAIEQRESVVGKHPRSLRTKTFGNQIPVEERSP